MGAHDTFVSPLAQRNASRRMLQIWSARHKFTLWRRIWLAVAQAQRLLGLPITEEQVKQIADHQEITDADIAKADEYERRLRHDVMAHVHALGDVAPAAKPILHLGLTSQDVVCNADVLILHEALDLTAVKVARVIDTLGEFAQRWKATPTLGYTHFQAAQPTTVGRRAAQWAYDLSLCLDRLAHTRASLRLRGLKGATGTQAAFMALFKNDPANVQRFEEQFVKRLGHTLSKDQVHLITGQTYPRVADAFVLSDLAALAAAIHKVCNDIRLLSNHKEIDEPMGDDQVGSSAMPYKQNPMRCERATGLCRFVMSMAQNGLDTAATQWLERTLDDSSNRRLSLPEAFLATDGALDLLDNIASGLVVHDKVCRAHVAAEMPFMMSESLMMAAVKLGRDRQAVHEAIRKHSREAAARVKGEGLPNDLLARLKADPLFAHVDIDAVLDPAQYIGRAPEQVDQFIAQVVAPLRARYADQIAALPDSEPAV